MISVGTGSLYARLVVADVSNLGMRTSESLDGGGRHLESVEESVDRGMLLGARLHRALCDDALSERLLDAGPRGLGRGGLLRRLLLGRSPLLLGGQSQRLLLLLGEALLLLTQPLLLLLDLRQTLDLEIALSGQLSIFLLLQQAQTLRLSKVRCGLGCLVLLGLLGLLRLCFLFTHAILLLNG